MPLMLLLGQAPPPSAPEEVVVTARTREAVDQMVRSVTQTERGKQIARWNNAICPRAIGIDPAHAAFVAKRISAVAKQIKVMVGRQRCRPNVLIVFTEEPTGFTAELVRRHPGLFGDPDNGLASNAERQRLLQPRPVRWLAASQTKGPRGVPIAQRLNPIYSASRLIQNTEEDSVFATVIVDSNALNQLTWGQISAYLAMVSLSRPDMDASFGPESILSLFDQRRKGKTLPSDLTQDDRRILAALYSSNAGMSADAQRSSITSSLRRAKLAGPEK